jgi:flagellar biosynthesis/type III secretory pathway chaperone
MRTVDDQLNLLEDTLVSEFRCLQKLVEITQKESSMLLKGNSSILMPILDDKEMIVDQIVMLEEQRGQVCEDLSQVYGVKATPTSVKAIMSYLEPVQGERIGRLCDGIVALSEQQDDLNVRVNTLAQSWIELIHSTQAYLLSFYQSPAAYVPPGARQGTALPPVWGTEHRA